MFLFTHSGICQWTAGWRNLGAPHNYRWDHKVSNNVLINAFINKFNCHISIDITAPYIIFFYRTNWSMIIWESLFFKEKYILTQRIFKYIYNGKRLYMKPPAYSVCFLKLILKYIYDRTNGFLWHLSHIFIFSNIVTVGPVAYALLCRQFGLHLKRKLLDFDFDTNDIGAKVVVEYALRNSTPLLLPNRFLRKEEEDIEMAGRYIICLLSWDNFYQTFNFYMRIR